MEFHYQVWGCFRTPREDIELAKRAVDAGFEGIWIGDHFQPWIDNRPYTHQILPWLGALMTEVPDVTVGTSVTCPIIRYEPPILAQSVATLDNMYPGRFELGVGVGEAVNECHFVDEWPAWETRAEMLVESIELMERLWAADDRIRYDGEHYQYDGIKLYTRPRSDVPLHWAAWGPKSSVLAGKHADHVTTAAGAALIENQVVPGFRDGRDEIDEPRGDHHVTTEFVANVGDPEALTEEVRRKGDFIPHDTELDTADPREIQTVADNRLSRMSDDELRGALNITDDPEEIVGEIEELEAAGVTRVLVGSTCGDPVETIRAFEENVIPRF